MMSGRKSGTAQREFKTYFSARGAAENVESCMSRISFRIAFGCITLPPLRGADGDVCIARRLASDVAFNILNAPVVGSPVMDELRRQGKERCLDRSALQGYSSYDSDNDSDHSVQRKNGRPGRKVKGRLLHLVVLMFDI